MIDNTDNLEVALRDYFHATAEAAPSDANLMTVVRQRVERHRRLPRARWPFAVLSAAAAAAVLVALVQGVVLVQGGHRAANPPLANSTAVTPSANSSPPGRVWTYQHLQVTLPASWMRDQLRCGTPDTNTVLLGNTAGGPLCAFLQPAGIIVVRLQAADDPAAHTYIRAAQTPSSLDGRAALRGSTELHGGRTVQIVVVPSIHTVLSVEAPNGSPLAQQITNSARLV